MRPCKESDFTKNGIEITDENKDTFESRFCPDFEGLEDEWRIRNGYANETDRVSFEIDIFKCNKDKNPNCGEDEDIDKVLK